MLETVQFPSASEGCHSMMTVPLSFSESSAVARRKATSSSLRCHVPFSSGMTSSPPVMREGGEIVGGMFSTMMSAVMFVVSPSSSTPWAVMEIMPSSVGVKVQVLSGFAGLSLMGPQFVQSGQ